MFRLNRNEELTNDKLTRIIQRFNLNERVYLDKCFNYYQGKQNILRKMYSDKSKPCNRIVKNYCYSIVNNYQGYITGVPITYTSEDDISTLLDIFNYNDIINEDSELLRNALIYGSAFEICYIDEEAKQRFKVIDTKECIPIYDDTLNQDLLYVIRYYKKPTWKPDEETRYYVEVYDEKQMTKYECNLGFSSFVLLEQVPHYFNDVPFSEFKLNEDKVSIFDKVISLQDAYNELISAEVDDFDAFVDAYLVLKGTTATSEDIESMRENRVLQIDTEDDVSFLTKSISDTQIENMLKNLNDSIHVISNSPDFNDEKFLAQSGIAMRYKLVGFENTSSGIVANMTKAIQRRIELLYNVIGLIQGDQFKDVIITFTRNLPVDNAEIVNTVNSLRGLVSDGTLLSLLPFVKNVQEELDKVQQEKSDNISMYSFGADNNEEE